MNKERIAKWDNLKFLMMACVVIGHALYYFVAFSELAKSIYFFLYTFHMPVFIFLAGLFAKRAINEKRFENVVEFLFLYVVIKTLETVGNYIAKGSITFHFLWAEGPSWFALAIAMFMLATMLIKNFNPKYMLMIALFVGCVAGLDTHFGNHFASMRILVFYPIFLAGYYIDPKKLANSAAGDKRAKASRLIKSIAFKLIALAILAITAFACFKNIEVLYPYVDFIKAKTAYTKLGIGLEGIAYRFACYIFWAIIIACFVELSPSRSYFWSWLGSRTMSTYIWHYIAIIILFYPLHGREFLVAQLPSLYVYAVIVIAIMIAIVTAYLPSFKVRDKGRKS